VRTFATNHPKPLGRVEPPDTRHLERWPLAPVLDTLTRPVPVIIGIPWRSNFDAPVFIAGRWWIGKADDLGWVRGGHEICLRPPSMTDLTDWWRFYDQGAEGACVGFAASRMMSLLNRARYDARWLYHEAQKIDGWPTPARGARQGRAACDILRARRTQDAGVGGAASGARHLREPVGRERRRDRLRRCRRRRTAPVGGLPLLNSWGEGGFPHVAWVPFDVARRGDLPAKAGTPRSS
jgi:hypothetical protein